VTQKKRRATYKRDVERYKRDVERLQELAERWPDELVAAVRQRRAQGKSRDTGVSRDTDDDCGILRSVRGMPEDATPEERRRMKLILEWFKRPLPSPESRAPKASKKKDAAKAVIRRLTEEGGRVVYDKELLDRVNRELGAEKGCQVVGRSTVLQALTEIRREGASKRK
jgi:hypothetical protein